MRQVLGAIIVVLVAGHAHAQSQSGGSSALAEQLFNQGRDLVKANQWADACPKFEASLRYDPVLGTRLNLATCYEHIGKIASAWGLYRESMELATKAGDTKRAEYAQRQATALERRLPKLAISAPPIPPADYVVKRDDTTVDAGAFGVALYVDPGTHKVTASAPGFEPFAVSVTLVEGKTETLAIPNLVATPVAAAAPARQTPTEPAAPASPTRKYMALGIGGAGVAAVAVGLVFGAKANSSFRDAKTLCGPTLVCSNDADYARDKKLMSDARSAATTSTVLMIGGGAAIAAGVVVLLTAPRSAERTTARLVPIVHGSGTGLALAGEF